jgi:hypothetical protein
MPGEWHGVFFQVNPGQPSLVWSSLVIYLNAVVPQHRLTVCTPRRPCALAPPSPPSALASTSRQARPICESSLFMSSSSTRQPTTQQPLRPNVVGEAGQQIVHVCAHVAGTAATSAHNIPKQPTEPTQMTLGTLTACSQCGYV